MDEWPSRRGVGTGSDALVAFGVVGVRLQSSDDRVDQQLGGRELAVGVLRTPGHVARQMDLGASERFNEL